MSTPGGFDADELLMVLDRVEELGVAPHLVEQLRALVRLRRGYDRGKVGTPELLEGRVDAAAPVERREDRARAMVAAMLAAGQAVDDAQYGTHAGAGAGAGARTRGGRP